MQKNNSKNVDISNQNISIPCCLFYLYILFFIIPVALRLFYNNFLFYFFSIIFPLIYSLYWFVLPKAYQRTIKYIMSVDVKNSSHPHFYIKFITDLRKKINNQQTNPHRKAINEALINWAEYNSQVFIFSIFIFLIQNVQIKDKVSLDINDEKILYLFIPICLYSTIFSRSKLNEIQKKLDEIKNEEGNINEHNEFRIKRIRKLKRTQHIILSFSFIICFLYIFNICECYLTIASYAMMLVVNCNQFLIELFHRTIPFLKD